MKTEHAFLLQPGTWLGEGTIKFTESPDWLKYYCRWVVSPEADGEIYAEQTVEVEGLPDKMENNFTFAEVTGGKFLVHLSNPLLGEIDGTGVYDDQVVAWEFREGPDQGFEGFEIYRQRDEGGYAVRAEFASIDQLRTIVEGSIWKQGET